MRADWILTDEERINKRQKIEENPGEPVRLKTVRGSGYLFES